MTKLELADMLDRFAGDYPNLLPWEFDDFTTTKAEPELEPYRQKLAAMIPPFDAQEIRAIARELRLNA